MPGRRGAVRPLTVDHQGQLEGDAAGTPGHRPSGDTGTGRASAREVVPEVIRGGADRILPVEDYDLVREHVRAELASLGYDVVAVRNGPETLEAPERTAIVAGLHR